MSAKEHIPLQSPFWKSGVIRSWCFSMLESIFRHWDLCNYPSVSVCLHSGLWLPAEREREKEKMIGYCNDKQIKYTTHIWSDWKSDLSSTFPTSTFQSKGHKNMDKCLSKTTELRPKLWQDIKQKYVLVFYFFLTSIEHKSTI